MEFVNGFINIFLDMSLYMLIGMLLAGVLHVLIKRDIVAKYLGRGTRFASVKGALLGVPMPLCSCGVLPMVSLLSKSGAETSAVLAFLIATPQTGIDSIIPTLGMMGIVFGVYCPLVTFVSGAAGGAIIQKIVGKKEKPKEIKEEHDDCSRGSCTGNCADMDVEKNANGRLTARLKSMSRYAFVEFMDDISLHFIIGVIIAAAITMFIPAGFLANLNIGSGLPGMLLMLVIGLPMYICSTSSIPVALALMAKGISPGAAFVFLFAGPATNAASIAVLVKTFGKKTVAVYLVVMSVFAVGFGLLLDGMIGWFSLPMPATGPQAALQETGAINIVAGILFGALLLRSLTSKLIRRLRGGHAAKCDTDKI